MRLSMGVRELALAGIRQRFPGASEAADLRVRLAVRLYGRATVARAFRDIQPDGAYADEKPGTDSRESLSLALRIGEVLDSMSVQRERRCL